MLEQKLFAEQKAFFAGGDTLHINNRMVALLKLKQSIQSHEQDILNALKADFSKCAFDTYTTEVLMVLNEIDDCVRHLEKWCKPKRAFAGIINFPAKGRIYHQPFGVVLIISPWNYPFMLAMSPLVGAIAAGNCVTLKPSSQTAHTADILQVIVNESFLSGQAQVVLGGHQSSDALLELPYDFIFFTGSPAIGKKVMEKASAHLTPVVLELGGKSPCIVDKTANIPQAARRIVWGKFVNAGQTCVAPDYLLAEETIKKELLEQIQHYIREFYYNADGSLSQDFPRIINRKHFERLTALIPSGTVLCGGTADFSSGKIEPTVLTDISFDSAVMQEEIFGPILPVIGFSDLRNVIEQINSRPKPLAFYYFSTDKKMIRTVLERTSSGGGCINDTVMHVASEKLPFGGVGNSGMGIYHGKYSFDTFSHIRSILHKSPDWELQLKYPPHQPDKIDKIKKLLFRS